MWTAERAFSRVHPKLVALIEAEKAVCGCMMLAVKQVARRVGASEHWVRRVTGRYGEVKIQAHHLVNVLREHVRLRRRRKNTNASAGHPEEASRVRPWKLGGIVGRNTSLEASPTLSAVETGSGLPRP
jgi:hypothetical protein